MMRKPKIEAFIRRAEELNARVGAGILKGTSRYLEVGHWLKRCDTTGHFYLTYHEFLEGSLKFLLANPGAEQPALLEFLLTADLEKHFPPIELASGGYGDLTATIKYVMACVVREVLSGRGAHSDLEARSDAAFRALWRLPGAAETEEMLKAYEALLDLAFGRHEKIIRVFERDLRFPLEKLENAARTLIKECYLLAQVATGTADEDSGFGARATVVILKYDYYLWRVDEYLPAYIEFLPVFLASWMYEEITKGATPAVPVVLASMAPRAVLLEMQDPDRE